MVAERKDGRSDKMADERNGRMLVRNDRGIYSRMVEWNDRGVYGQMDGESGYRRNNQIIFFFLSQ